MKKIVSEFFRRGLIAGSFGPLVLAIIYLILQQQIGVETLAVNDVCRGIFSITALAFIVGGMNVVYQIEELPLMLAILIHGVVLYFAYLGTYLLNDWLENGKMPLVVFSVIFVAGYLIIWAVIYFIIKRNTNELNTMLTQKQEGAKVK